MARNAKITASSHNGLDALAALSHIRAPGADQWAARYGSEFEELYGAAGKSRARAYRSAVAISGLAILLGACSADTAMFRRDWNWWSNSQARQAPLTRAAPMDAYAAPDGSCSTNAAAVPGGIALGMTECELIGVAGPTGQIQIAQNERGERTAVFTYPEGERAGIYRFVSGLLVAIDRVPEPPRQQRRQQRRAEPPPQRAAPSRAAPRQEPRGY